MTDKERMFSVRYRRDDNGTWLAEVFRYPTGKRLGVATHGRTLASTEANVREALALWFDLDDEDAFTLLPRYPAEVARVAVEAGRQRRDARLAEARAATSLASAARQLLDQGLSLRDIGAVLGISHQRVQQLTTAREQVAPKKASSRPSQNPFAGLDLSNEDLIFALAMLLIVGVLAWAENKKTSESRLVVKTPARPLPAIVAEEPQLAQVLDFTRAWAQRHHGKVDVPSELARAVEQRTQAI